MSNGPKYDLDEWEEMLRRVLRKRPEFDACDAVAIRRAIDDAPGETLAEKRAYWENWEEKHGGWNHGLGKEPKGFFQRAAFKFKVHRKYQDFVEARDLILLVLQAMIDEHGREATARAKPAKREQGLDPVAERTQAALEAATRRKAHHAAIRVYEDQRAQDVAAFDPTSDEYKRRWASWSRLIEDEMKKG